MRRARRALLLALAVALLGAVTASCNGTTGDTLLTFSAYAAGAPGASQPFKAGSFTIQLTAAKMLIGAAYFDESPPGTGFDGPVCIASGVYAAQVPGPVIGTTAHPNMVDLLSTAPQEFSVYGSGTADTALSWDIWLTNGDVNEINFAPVVELQGTATDSQGNVVSFGAIVSINADNRNVGSSDPAQPGLNPICKSRIVQIATNVTFSPGGTLYITVDPRVWFDQQTLPIDFSSGQLPLVTDPNCNPDTAVSTVPADFALPPETPPPSTQTCGGSGQPCCADDACLDALTCTGPGGLCGPTFCIPNSSLLSGSDPGANAGEDLFTEVISGAPFSVSYVRQPP
jgi:hypothetical protein